MANILIFNEVSFRAIRYLRSVNTPDYSSRSDVLVNPDLSSVTDIALRYWKVDSELVVKMTRAEQDAVDAEHVAAAEASSKMEGKQLLADADGMGRLLRAMLGIILSELNVLRQQHGLPARTLAQFKARLASRIDSGDAE